MKSKHHCIYVSWSKTTTINSTLSSMSTCVCVCVCVLNITFNINVVLKMFFPFKNKGALLPEGSKIVLTNVLGSRPYFCISWNVYSSKGNHSYAQGWETRKYSLVITIPKKKTMSSLYIGS